MFLFFIKAILVMVTIAVLCELYNHTIGTFLFNRKMFKACREMEAEQNHLDPKEQV